MNIKIILVIAAALLLLTLFALGLQDNDAAAGHTGETTSAASFADNTSITAGTVTQTNSPTVRTEDVNLPETEVGTIETTTPEGSNTAEGSTTTTVTTTESKPVSTEKTSTTTEKVVTTTKPSTTATKPATTTKATTTIKPETTPTVVVPVTTTKTPTTSQTPVTTESTPVTVPTTTTVTTPTVTTTVPATTTKPAETEPAPDTNEPKTSDPASLTYEEYLAMTPAEQQAHFESFASAMEYMEWFNRAKAEYDANKDDIVIEGGGSIDIGDIIGGNN